MTIPKSRVEIRRSPVDINHKSVANAHRINQFLPQVLQCVCFTDEAKLKLEDLLVKVDHRGLIVTVNLAVFIFVDY